MIQNSLIHGNANAVSIKAKKISAKKIEVQITDNGLGDLELGLGAGPLGGLAVEQTVDLGLGQRHRGIAGPDETGDALGVGDEAPRVVGHVHLDQHITGHGALLDLDLLAVLDLGDLLGRHSDRMQQASIGYGLEASP